MAKLEKPVGRLSGLSGDGERLYATGFEKERRFLLGISRADGQAVGQPIPLNYRTRALTCLPGGGYLISEQPEWGWDEQHQRIQLWPRPGQTKLHRLTLAEKKSN